MPTAVVYSRGELGIQAPLVTVETHLSNGSPRFNIVGLPEKVVKESKDRVRSAIMNSQFSFPNRVITVNLAPAELPKEGGRFDLAIALSILAASQQIPMDPLEHYELAGELGLTGQLRHVAGLIPFALATRTAKRILILPNDDINEISLIEQLPFIAATTLIDVCELLINYPKPPKYAIPQKIEHTAFLDIKEIKGQKHGKRALEIAASGGHNLLMVGPPGTGKTMLAQRLPSLLPLLSPEQAIEVAAIQSISRQHQIGKAWLVPPFRHPHHSASGVALVGGGNPPRPGDISLAHHGVLFLDELPEFSRSSLESLREPLESGKISLSRAGNHREYPANFQLITAMNPCPCGHYGNPKGNCDCSPSQIQRYQQRISGPLLDRIDLKIQLLPVQTSTLFEKNTISEENSETVAQRVLAARTTQYRRQGKLNKQLNTQALEQYCQLEEPLERYLLNIATKLHLSHRAIHRVLKVSRTIADLDHCNNIEKKHLEESLAYRLAW